MVTNQSQRDAAAMFRLGARVDRATAALPQTAAGTIFTISGGRVLFSLIVGEVTVVIQTQANNTKLKLVPTTGSTVDLCAVKDITALEVGGKLVVNGTAATALVQANAGAIIAETVPVICAIGTCSSIAPRATPAPSNGQSGTSPIDDGALVVAA
jgi:hypothetical protein